MDLPASNRLERRLVFKAPAPAPAALGGNAPAPAIEETLRLENPWGATYHLTRIITLDGGLQSSLLAEGTDPAELLALIEAVPPQRQWRAGSGFAVALNHYLEPAHGSSKQATPRLVLTQAVAHVGGLTLTMRLPRRWGVAADIELAAPAGDPIELPEDLIAVVGWDWTRLHRERGAWTSKLRLRGREPRRSESAEHKLERTLIHLARTLAEPPGRFHDRLVRARWGAAFRRAIPVLTAFGLVAGALALPRLALTEGSVPWMMMFHAPTLLIACAFCLQEMPRFEIPPWPQRSSAPAWREPGDSSGSGVKSNR